jgi:taurine dioxygenase
VLGVFVFYPIVSAGHISLTSWNGFDPVKQFVGLNQVDSARLFQTLQEHITKPENVVRWRWKEGDVAIWDNQATQHRATADFGLQRRTLRRATIHGEVPVAIDGRQSRTVRQEKAVQYEPA